MGALSQEAQHPDVIAYIEQYRATAVREMARTGVPAAIKLAQGIIETQAGKGELVLRSNNHFGIKCKSTWTGERVFHDDDEKGECFRKYASAEESWRDHSDFLRSQPRYASLFRLDPTDHVGWARGLKSAGYATDPAYPEKLIRYVETYRLHEFSFQGLALMRGEGTMEEGRSPMPTSAPDASTVILPSGPAADPEAAGANQNSVAVARADGSLIRVNDTRAVRAAAGTSLLALAETHGVRLSQLLEFNEIEEYRDILERDQTVYLQRKPRKGLNLFHIVAPGETPRDVARIQAIRLESLQNYNDLTADATLSPGQRLYLQGLAPKANPAPPAVTASKSEPSPIPKAPEAAKRSGSIEPVYIMHTVKAGETLYGLSKRYGVRQEEIVGLNGLGSTGLKAGATVRIPVNR